MKTPKLKQFKVRGVGRFPIDMLRYDSCWPETGTDAIDLRDAIDNQHREEHSITLATHSPNAPTVGRWNSFGWRVIED